MTDRPFAADGDPAVAPEPGYYPDPSIPGFVRYWGGSAWVPGTSRPAPAAGEVLEPPRYATRRPAPEGAGARVVRPPVVPEAVAAPGVVAPEGGMPGVAASVPGVVPEPAALDSVVSMPVLSEPVVPEPVVPEPVVAEPVVSEPLARVRVGPPAGGGDTGPVYFDQTSGGASFVLGPRLAEVIGGPVFRTVDRPGAPSSGSSGVPSQGLPSGFGGAEPPVGVDGPGAVGAVPGAVPAPGPGSLPGSGPAPGSGPVPAPAFGESGWQADPRRQRGLMETGDAPRWVSWGVIPEAPDAEEGRAEPERAPAAVELAAAGAPAVAVAVRDAPVPAVLASGPVPVVGEGAIGMPGPGRPERLTPERVLGNRVTTGA
ncbi:DUF2510 domain-containing protein [Kitasatospora sp. NPDC004799]|uniref:DUF2510 domain-containing protein n=1 Tax=Kitasatospora sp. NPDC004799 TaxID=3154460 RepID=UPI0033B78D6B